ncbi:MULTISPECIES: hypothetical protein [unclassified Halomonas]|uniref:hypothetical protein n=1 Tax=unclassified Halomonas TaxID=2609666 RepID=UPI000697C2F1|nr:MULTISPECIES: hypothetical protein [unclassified Halomonas]MCO7215463.1 hypothetical protein [Halomonas sp. OfavH-34-E]
MKLLRVAASAAVILSLAASVQAGVIRPDCDAEKVAKNAALEATVGVSGRCTADRAVENAKDNVNDRVDDARDGVADHVDDARGGVYDRVVTAHDSVERAGGKVDDALDKPVRTLLN